MIEIPDLARKCPTQDTPGPTANQLLRSTPCLARYPNLFVDQRLGQTALRISRSNCQASAEILSGTT